MGDFNLFWGVEGKWVLLSDIESLKSLGIGAIW